MLRWAGNSRPKTIPIRYGFPTMASKPALQDCLLGWYLGHAAITMLNGDYRRIDFAEFGAVSDLMNSKWDYLHRQESGKKPATCVES